MKYVNRNGQPFDAQLVKIAKASPKSYAKLIVKRNTALLASLDEVVKTAGTAKADKFPIFRRLDLGCPHCQYSYVDGHHCKGCLWTRFNADEQCDGSIYCAHIHFPSGYNLSDVSGRNDSVALEYGTETCSITVRWAPEPGDIARIRSYLEDHVDWAQLKCWGTKPQRRRR